MKKCVKLKCQNETKMNLNNNNNSYGLHFFFTRRMNVQAMYIVMRIVKKIK